MPNAVIITNMFKNCINNKMQNVVAMTNKCKNNIIKTLGKKLKINLYIATNYIL